jgi:hypothetical protein
MQTPSLHKFYVVFDSIIIGGLGIHDQYILLRTLSGCDGLQWRLYVNLEWSACLLCMIFHCKHQIVVIVCNGDPREGEIERTVCLLLLAQVARQHATGSRSVRAQWGRPTSPIGHWQVGHTAQRRGVPGSPPGP